MRGKREAIVVCCVERIAVSRVEWPHSTQETGHKRKLHAKQRLKNDKLLGWEVEAEVDWPSCRPVTEHEALQKGEGRRLSGRTGRGSVGEEAARAQTRNALEKREIG